MRSWVRLAYPWRRDSSFINAGLSNEQADAVVRRIFALAIDGYGLSAITKKLNSDKELVERSGKHWPRSNVAWILKNRAVVGEYQPYTIRDGKRKPDGDPIPNYYPAIINEEEWYAARGALASRRRKPGRQPKHGVNIFSGLVYDARDGGKMHLMLEGKKNGPRLTSANAVQGINGCRPMSFPFPIFEKAVLYCLREIDPSDILPNQKRQDKTKTLRDQLAGVQAEIDKLKGRLQAKYTDAIADVLEKQEDARQRIKTELEAAMQEAACPVARAWEQCETLIDVVNRAPDGEDAKVRLRAALRRMVKAIHLYVVPKRRDRGCFVQIDFAEGNQRGYFIVETPPLVVGGRKRDGFCMVCSQTADGPARDIRKPETQAFVEKFLTNFELPAEADREEVHKPGFHTWFIPAS